MSSEQIKIGVDSSEAMSSFQRIKSEADALAQSMIANAREQGISGQNIIKDLETQIQLLERRNKLNFEQQKVASDIARDSGELSEKGYKNQMFDIKMDEKEAKLQTQLLKELVENTKLNARQGLLSENIANEREDADRDLAAGMAGAALMAAIRTPESESTGVGTDVGADVARGKEKRGVGEKIGHGLVTGTEHLFDMMKAPNYYEMMLETGKKVTEVIASTGTPVLSQLAAVAGAGLAYIQDAFSKFLAYEKSAYKMVSINGALGGGNFTKYGVDKIESAEEYVRVARARGTSENMYDSTLQSYQLQKGYGLDSGSAYSLMTLMRGKKGWQGGDNSTDIAAYVQGSAVESGIAKKGDTSILPEYLNTLISIGRENLRVTGEVDMKQTTKIVNAITHLDDSFKNIEVLTEAFSILQSGNKPASSPQVQALQYSVLSQLKDAQGNPANLSMWEMDKVQNDVNNPYYQQYQDMMIKRIKDMNGGNQEMANFTFQSIYGGAMGKNGMTEKILWGNWTNTSPAGDIVPDFSPLTRTGASDIDVQEAEMVNSKIKDGEAAKEKMDEILEGLEAIVDGLVGMGEIIAKFFRVTDHGNVIAKQNEEAYYLAHGGDAQGNVYVNGVLDKKATKKLRQKFWADNPPSADPNGGINDPNYNPLDPSHPKTPPSTNSSGQTVIPGTNTPVNVSTKIVPTPSPPPDKENIVVKILSEIEKNTRQTQGKGTY